MIKYLNIKPETVNLLDENIHRTLDDINQSKILYDPPHRVIEIKTKISNLDLIKLKSFCTAKETIIKMKKTTHRMGENIYNTPNRLIAQIYKQLIKFNIQKPNNPIKKWTKDLNRHFFKEYIQMVKGHMKRC